MHTVMIADPDRKRAIAREVLADLPEWFGIPESTEEYIRESACMPFFAAMEQDEVIGFMALKETSPFTCEIYVTGVKKRFHRRGAGSAMFADFCEYARQRGYQFVQVKTVAAGCYPEYDATRMAYEHMGFVALEVFPTLWDECNPCLIMVKAL